MINKELAKAIDKWPIDSIVQYRGKDIGWVIGYKRANETGSIEIQFQHYAHLASGKQGMFSMRAHYYTCKSGFEKANLNA